MLQREYRIQGILMLWALMFSILLSMGVRASDHDESVMWVLGSYSSEASAERVARELESLAGQKTALQEIQRSGSTLFRVLMPLGTESEQSRLSSLLLSADFDRPWRLSVKQSTLMTEPPQLMAESIPGGTAGSTQSAEEVAETPISGNSQGALSSQALAPVESKPGSAISDRLSPDSDYHPIRLFPRN